MPEKLSYDAFKEKTEAALHRPEQRLRLFIDSSPDLIFLKDKELRYKLVNAANAAFFGFTEAELEALIQELQKALAEVKTLSGLLPICSHCKKIKDDKGYWQQIENYIQERSAAQFTHGICRECAERHYPGMKLYDD